MRIHLYEDQSLVRRRQGKFPSVSLEQNIFSLQTVTTSFFNSDKILLKASRACIISSAIFYDSDCGSRYEMHKVTCPLIWEQKRSSAPCAGTLYSLGAILIFASVRICCSRELGERSRCFEPLPQSTEAQQAEPFLFGSCRASNADQYVCTVANIQPCFLLWIIQRTRHFVLTPCSLSANGYDIFFLIYRNRRNGIQFITKRYLKIVCIVSWKLRVRDRSCCIYPVDPHLSVRARVPTCCSNSRP